MSSHRPTVPQIYKYFDVHDIAGLIAPRPLLIEMGVYDTCFFIEDQLAGFEALQRIYAAAGVEEDLWVDIHPGEHMFANNKAHEFVGKYL
ncbi:alpha/beta hydrolase family protein [bacterium]|nr:alpha/beta hydrolase family protein [bacterium]